MGPYHIIHLKSNLHINHLRSRAYSLSHWWGWWGPEWLNNLLKWPHPRSRKWQPTPVCLPGKSHGQRSLEAAAHGVTKNWIRATGHAHTHVAMDSARTGMHFSNSMTTVLHTLSSCSGFSGHYCTSWNWKLCRVRITSHSSGFFTRRPHSCRHSAPPLQHESTDACWLSAQMDQWHTADKSYMTHVSFRT